MKFHEQLNQYIESIGVSGKELSEYSGLSQPLISRYRKGNRIPSSEGEQIEKLAAGLSKAAERRGEKNLEPDQIKLTLLGTLPKNDNADISFHLNNLIIALDINVSKMAQALHYDASYISKVRQGKRKPSDKDIFCCDIIVYVSDHFYDESSRAILSELMGCNLSELDSKDSLRVKLAEWFHASNQDQTGKMNYMDHFLEKLDEFDLQEYITAIQFDKLKVPKVPFQIPASRHYVGLKEMREGELDFLKSTVLSKSMEPLYLCSDMPVEDMAEDTDFAKKYMFGLAMVLKKGLHINMIHNVDRPMADMMLGLENWIPLYMTGQITPRYLKGNHNQIYQHLHYCSGTVAMMGEGICGRHERAHYYLTNKKDEVRWMREYMEDLFRKSDSLMDIYREGQEEKLERFLKKNCDISGERRRILTSPPLFVLSKQEFADILKQKNLSTEIEREIISSFFKHKEKLEYIIEKNSIFDSLSVLTMDEYQKQPVWVSFPGGFVKHRILLTYEEYVRCIEAAKIYSQEHLNYHFLMNREKGFHNIQITIHKGKWCMISKGKSPMIHFVIRHPKLRFAFENMWFPIIEKGEKRDYE